MIDSDLHPYVEKSLKNIALWLTERGIDANMITVIGAAMAVPAFVALILQAYGAALFFILLNRFCDGLDGVVARHQRNGPTDFGTYLDIVLDAVFYSAVIFFFALGQPQNALAAAFLILALAGSSASFLAHAVIMEKRRPRPDIVAAEQADSRNTKSFHHTGGFTEGFETILLLVGICLLPSAFTPMAVLFGIFCWVTMTVRTVQARRLFAMRPQATPQRAAA